MKLSKVESALCWAYRSGYCFAEEAAAEYAAAHGLQVTKRDLGQYGDGLRFVPTEPSAASFDVPAVSTANAAEAFAGEK